MEIAPFASILAPSIRSARLSRGIFFMGFAPPASPLFAPVHARRQSYHRRTMASPLTSSPAWQALSKHRDAMSSVHMRDLFAQDPGRFARFSLEAIGIFLDYSKHRITEETMKLLFSLARQVEVEKWRDRMFAGERI